jgi:hypothetical protein
MYGLIVVFALAAYALLLVLGTCAAYRGARKRGWRKASSVAAGMAAFLAIYAPVLWDQIPTFVRHRHYCANEAGFWVYETPEAWAQRNQRVLGTLSARKQAPTKRHDGALRFWTTERFFTDRIQDERYAHAILREEHVFYDSVTGARIARAVNFYRGKAGNVLGIGGSLDDIRQYLALGLGNRECGDPSTSEKMGQLRLEFMKLGQGK